MTYEYDEEKKKLVITVEQEPDFYDRFYRRVTQDVYIIQAKAFGFSLRHLTGNWRKRNDTQSIPGNYTLGEIAGFIWQRLSQSLDYADPQQYNATFISDLLLETELWEHRGFLRNEALWPKDLFTIIPLSLFVQGGIKSYRNWMHEVVYKDPIFPSKASSIQAKILSGEYPERLHSIRGWNKFDIYSLRHLIRYRAWKHPQWGVFQSQYWSQHRNVLVAHPEAWKEFGSYVAACTHFKGARVPALLDQVYLAQGTAGRALRCANLCELVLYIDALQERMRDLPLSPLLKDYQTPPVSLPGGWAWVNRVSFWDLGSLYNCCISSDSYARGLVSGTAAIAYVVAPHGKGAIGYYRRSDSGVWSLAQQAGWANSRVDATTSEELQTISRSLNAWEEKRRAEHKAELKSKINKYKQLV